MIEHVMGPFCQSCGMPLKRPTDFGTMSEGIRNNDYCHYCYENGRFTDPSLTQASMLQICVEALIKRGMPEAQARALMTTTLPRLKRWRTA